ncbi:putative SMP-30/Gluconolactonase/LRE-like region domain-containing protein [Seiridium unicorne]|uniref:SMP-30/Gluconolactonase/LRE-like region domain-containing protein n=1 Tax=Seiridium unicorne TaxID=138068 RepID=A0ABR2UU35_9PEZI
MAGCITSWFAAAAAIAVVLFSTIASSFPTNVCATNAAPQANLDLNASSLDIGDRPWGLVYLNESIALAAVNFSLTILDVSQFQPRVTAVIPYPSNLPYMGNDDIDEDGYGYRDIKITKDQQNAYVATGYGAIIYDIPKALQGRNDSIVGVLSHDGYAGRSSIELQITADDKFVFVSQEFGSNQTYGRGAIEVYNVTRQDNGTVSSSWRGYIILGFATIGQQFSTDHTKLFVTSEMNGTATSLNQTMGIISVLDVQTLRVTPGKSLIKKVDAGCHPVRAAMSLDGKHLWVTQREANQVMAFDTSKLMDNTSTEALTATVNTGTSPIGITAIKNHILTADSNRFGYSNASTGVTVVNAQGAIGLDRVNFPQIPTGPFPRALAVSPSGNTVLVSEFDGATIRAIDVSSLNVE